MKALQEDPASFAIIGNTMQLGEGHSIAIHHRNGRCWVAEFREGHGELFDATSWFRSYLGVLRYSHGRRMAALATVQPMIHDVINRVEDLHRQAVRPDNVVAPIFASVVWTAWRRCGELAARIRGYSGRWMRGRHQPAE